MDEIATRINGDSDRVARARALDAAGPVPFELTPPPLRVQKAGGCEWIVYVAGTSQLLGTILAHPISGECFAARRDGQPAHDLHRRRIWIVEPLGEAQWRFTPPPLGNDLGGVIDETSSFDGTTG